MILLLPMMVLACAGCDGQYATKQRVELRVLDRATGAPAKGSVALARSRDRIDRLFREGKLNTGVADVDGRATFDVDTSVVVGGLLNNSEFGAFTGKWDDRLSGQRYFARTRGPTAEEDIELVMNVGERAEGKTFTLEVVSIGKPEANTVRR
jgi:5-hydroxyisourate hydrolase-like protein (transthyretin family)